MEQPLDATWSGGGLLRAEAVPVSGGRVVPSRVAALSRYAWLLPVAGSAILIGVGLRGFDLAAQEYRVWAFGTQGYLLWDLNWYGGHADLGYSVLFPLCASLLGTVPLMVGASAVSTALAGWLIGPARTWPAVLARWWFAISTMADVVVGRGPFAAALPFAVGALLAVKGRRMWLAAGCALLTSLFSPLAAVFLMLAGLILNTIIGWRRVTPLLAASAGVLVAALAGDGGFFPFPWTALVGQLAIVAVGVLVTPRDYPAVRRGLLIYGAACAGLFAVPTPVGGNIARLAEIAVGPLAAYVLVRAHRRRVLALITLPILAFQALPVLSSTAFAGTDPSAQRSYYTEVVSYLRSHVGQAARVEIPFTQAHWEAAFVAESVPLARGWVRQVDLAHNAVLYSPLTPEIYRQWLDDNGVDLVALPDSVMDTGGRPEAQLLAHPPGWLTLVYRDAHWRVWRVQSPTPIATGVARLTAQTPGSVALQAAAAGQTLVRIRWSPYWHVEVGNACVAHAAQDWTTLLTFAPGEVKLDSRFSADRDDICSDTELSTGRRLKG